MCSDQVFKYLVLIADEICEIYNRVKKLVTEEVDELNEEMKSLKLINKFIIYKLLKELNRKICERLSETLVNSVFAFA